MIRAMIAGIRLGRLLCSRIDDVRFAGRCPCGCEKWVVVLDEERYTIGERTYDKLRYIRNAS